MVNLMPPAEEEKVLPRTPSPEVNDNNSVRLDFDSYLAETERLLAQAGNGIKKNSSSSSPEYSGPHSTFILLDSGGWQEVVVVPPDEEKDEKSSSLF